MLVPDKAAHPAMASPALRLQLLYKNVLRAHRAHLPAAMRSLGDSYAREEFRRHRGAKEEHLSPFFKEWRGYLDQVQGASISNGDFGADLDRDTLQNLTDEQKTNLAKLEMEAKGNGGS